MSNYGESSPDEWYLYPRICFWSRRWAMNYRSFRRGFGWPQHGLEVGFAPRSSSAAIGKIPQQTATAYIISWIISWINAQVVLSTKPTVASTSSQMDQTGTLGRFYWKIMACKLVKLANYGELILVYPAVCKFYPKVQIVAADRSWSLDEAF